MKVKSHHMHYSHIRCSRQYFIVIGDILDNINDDVTSEDDFSYNSSEKMYSYTVAVNVQYCIYIMMCAVIRYI